MLLGFLRIFCLEIFRQFPWFFFSSIFFEIPLEVCTLMTFEILPEIFVKSFGNPFKLGGRRIFLNLSGNSFCNSYEFSKYFFPNYSVMILEISAGVSLRISSAIYLKISLQVSLRFFREFLWEVLSEYLWQFLQK